MKNTAGTIIPSAVTTITPTESKRAVGVRACYQQVLRQTPPVTYIR